MKERFWWSVAALVTWLLVMAAGCGDDEEDGGGTTATSPAATEAAAIFECDRDYPGTAPDASGFPLEVIDDEGETVSLEAPPEAIISLSAAHVETLYAIGAGDQLIAGDLFSNCPRAAEELEQLDSFQPSVEAITALEPDVVMLFYDPGGLRDSLEAVGINVLFLTSPESVDGVLEQMLLLGEATGHAGEAEALVSAMDDRIDEVVAALPVGKPPSVFHELDSTLFTVGPGSFVGDLYEILEAENIAEATGEAYPQMTQEAVIAAAPDVIILADEAAGESADTVSARPGWDEVPAVQNLRIYAVDPDIVSRPGPRLVEALETLAGLLYAE